MRVRFAPSPTGDLHFGNARTAILNWIVARKTEDGKFILRIEDTDKDRNDPEAEKGIYEALKWLGIDWDEGPDIGGPFHPYRQSESFDIYQKYASLLKENGFAYECFCTEEELEKRKKKALEEGRPPIYDRKCLYLSEEEKQKLREQGRKPVLRFFVREGEVRFNDKIKGDVVFETKNISDFIILRSDGSPTYNFAVVIDDFRMKIDLVIRGDDHLANTPKQILVYEALSKILGEDKVKIPEFAHIPMILGPDRSKLSKRHGAVSVKRAKEKGYLPEALFNYLSLLGWSSPTGEEILSKERLIKEVEIDRISSAAAVFDFTKLNWINQEYLKKLSDREFIEFVWPFLEKTGWDLSDRKKVEKMILLVRDGVSFGEEIVKYLEVFFKEFDITQLNDKLKEVLDWESSKIVIEEFYKKLKDAEWTKEGVFAKIKEIQKENKIKGKFLYMPIRVATTLEEHGPDLVEVILIFGKDEILKRLKIILKEYYKIEVD